MKLVLWGEQTRDQLEALRDGGALPVIPIGAIEQHAEHLPVDTDAFNAMEVSKLAAVRTQSAQIVILPSQNFGFSPHHKTWPGTISLSGSTLTAVLIEIAQSLHRTGFKRMLFVNGHGGNTGPLLTACNSLICDGVAAGFVHYFDPAQDEWIKELLGSHNRLGHACEYETSLQMALRPDFAEHIQERSSKLPSRLLPPFGGATETEKRLLERGMNWAWLFNEGDAGYFGDPGASTAQNSRVLLDKTVGGLATFFDEFASADLKVATTVT